MIPVFPVLPWFGFILSALKRVFSWALGWDHTDIIRMKKITIYYCKQNTLVTNTGTAYIILIFPNTFSHLFLLPFLLTVPPLPSIASAKEGVTAELLTVLTLEKKKQCLAGLVIAESGNQGSSGVIVYGLVVTYHFAHLFILGKERSQ